MKSTNPPLPASDIVQLALDGRVEEAVLQVMIAARGKVASDVLVCCMECKRLDALKLLIPSPILNFKGDTYYPVRVAVLSHFTEAVDVMIPFIPSLVPIANLFIEQWSAIPIKPNQPHAGLEYFGLLLPDGLQEKWLNSLGGKACPQMEKRRLVGCIPQNLNTKKINRL